MLSSRLVGHNWQNRLVTIVVGVRLDHHAAPSQPVAAKEEIPLEQLENPTMIQKAIIRFKGLPRKGEAAPPKAVLDDIGKKVYITETLPKVPKDFKEFPERDLVNYPYPERPMYAPNTRFEIIPDHWCREVEKISGTSGPYMAVASFFGFCLNKEWIAMDNNGYMLFLFILPSYLLIKHGFSYKVQKNAYGWWKEAVKVKKDFIESELKEAKDFRRVSKEQAESLKAAQENFPTIFRENLALQLEATYRKNVESAWSELKRRLDYLKEVQETKERFAKEILLKSITEGVRKQIENNEGGIREKYMDQCIEQLKNLAVAK